MAKYMTEPGLTPASRSRLAIQMHTVPKPWEYGGVTEIRRIIIEPATFMDGKRDPIPVRPEVLVLPADSEKL